MSFRPKPSDPDAALEVPAEAHGGCGGAYLGGDRSEIEVVVGPAGAAHDTNTTRVLKRARMPQPAGRSGPTPPDYPGTRIGQGSTRGYGAHSVRSSPAGMPSR